MSTVLSAFIDGHRVGRFTRDGNGPVSFTFDDDWRRAAGRLELSMSMPKTRRRHTGDAPLHFLWNLLPDSEAVLERWGSTFGVSPRNPMALLSHVGMDTAGAVQLADTEESTLTGPAGNEQISAAEIAAHIRQLRTDPEAWLIPGHHAGYFSLAGAQSKFALARSADGSWSVPTGRAASTHILKPGIRGLARSDLNEHLSLAAAAHLGLPTAGTAVERFEDESVIVVTRYDRVLEPDGTVVRLHQEDMAQATGTHPVGKYQNEGGPGIVQIVNLIRHARGKDAGSAGRFFDATVFNWAALGTDAHAKNYSLLHSATRGPSLAPLYDVATALPYSDINTRKAKLAMSFGGHFRQYEIEARHLIADAAALQFDPDWAHDRAVSIVDGLADAYSHAARDAALTGEDAEFAARIVDEAATRTERLRRELRSATPAPGAPAPSASRRPVRFQTQPRTGNGRYDRKENNVPASPLIDPTGTEL